MIKLLHAADFHLDSPLAGLPPEKSRQRRGELRDTVRRLFELASFEEVDIMLLSGDLFDTASPYRESRELLISLCGSTRARVFISPGNHDFYSPLSPYAREKWPENVHIFTKNSIEAVEMPGLTVYGAAFTSDVCLTPLLEGFRAEGGGVKIMTLHGDMSGSEERYDPVSETQIAASGLDYLALGHTHTLTGPRAAGGTTYAYPGCLEGRGFDETGDKGALLVSIDGGVKAEFVPLASRRYVRVELDVTGKNPALAAAEAVKNENDIYRLILTGECEGIGSIILNVFAYEIIDRTRPKRPPAPEDSLKGLFIQKILAAREAASEEERERYSLALKFGLAALERGERPGGTT